MVSEETDTLSRSEFVRRRSGKEKRRRITLPVAALANLRLTSIRYCLFATTRRAGFRNSNWALTFSICADWSFTSRRETRNRVFQFRDPLLLLLEFIELSLEVWAPLGVRILTFFPLRIDKGRA